MKRQEKVTALVLWACAIVTGWHTGSLVTVAWFGVGTLGVWVAFHTYVWVMRRREEKERAR